MIGRLIRSLFGYLRPTGKICPPRSFPARLVAYPKKRICRGGEWENRSKSIKAVPRYHINSARYMTRRYSIPSWEIGIGLMVAWSRVLN